MSRMSPDADGQQTEWSVHYKRVGKRWTDRKYYYREWTARRYANRIAEHPDKYAFVDLQRRRVRYWQTVERRTNQTDRLGPSLGALGKEDESLIHQGISFAFPYPVTCPGYPDAPPILQAKENILLWLPWQTDT